MHRAVGVGLVGVAIASLTVGCSSGGSPAPLSSVAITGPRPSAGETRTGLSSSSGSSSPTGGAENRSSSPARSSDCPLVPGAAVAAAFAVRVTSISTTATPVGRPSCRFLVRAGVVGGTIIVTSAPALSAAAFAAARSAARGRSVDGLGLGAYLTEGPATLRVRRTADVLAVSASLGEPGGARQDTYRLRTALVSTARAAS